MKRLIKFTTTLTLSAALSISQLTLNAEEFCIEECGIAYEETCSAPKLSPCTALGAVVLAAIVTVLIQGGFNSSGSHSHSNLSSNSSTPAK